MRNKEDNHHPSRPRCRGAGEKTAQGSSALRKHWMALKYPHAGTHPPTPKTVSPWGRTWEFCLLKLCFEKASCFSYAGARAEYH